MTQPKPIKILHLLSQRPDSTGSGIYIQAMLREAAKKGHRNFLVAGIQSDWPVQLDAIDETMVAKGQELFDFNCTACHLPYSEKIGPALIGITERRTPEWIVNMILNPVEMAKTDPICLGLLAQFNTVMADQNLSQEEARSILEYFRTLNIDNAPDPS